MAKWLTDLRIWIVALLRDLTNEPAGELRQAQERPYIDDGVDYSQPRPLPSFLTGDDVLRQYGETLQKQGDESAGVYLAEAQRIKEARDSYLKKLAEVDPVYQFQFDKPNTYSENLSQFNTADPLREWDVQGGFGLGNAGIRKDVLTRTHLAYERNPLAATAVRLTTQFSIGKGLTITYRNKEVEEILEAFRNDPDNSVETYEKTLINDLQIDGEVIIRFVRGAFGKTLIYPLKPWEIWWIQRDPFIQKRLESFHWVAGLTSGVPGDYRLQIEDIPATDVLFVPINMASYEVRGRPELFRILPWLRAYKDWLENRARQNHWRGALLWDVSLKDATAQQVASKRAQYRQPPSPGSLAIHNEKETWQALSAPVGASDASEDGRQIKLMSAIGSELPEYMLSDGSNSNMASATAQQLPALRKFTEIQDIAVEQIWRPIYTRVLQNAIDAGVLTDEVVEQDEDGNPIMGEDGFPKLVDACEAFDIMAPELESDDPSTLAQALSTAANMGWVSNETASQRMGYDYRMEQKKIRKERQEAQTERYNNVLPTGTTPTLNPTPFPQKEEIPNGENNSNGSTSGDDTGDSNEPADNPFKGTQAMPEMSRN